MATTSTALTVPRAGARPRLRSGALAQSARVFARDRQAMVGLLIIAIVGGAALAAPLISPWDPLTSASVERLSPIGTPGHVLGTDEQGRDILSRLIWGGRASLLVGSHSHIPTADLQILPKGTAYQTDAGMCGDYDSVIGMKKDAAIHKFVRKIPGERLSPADGPGTLCGVMVETDDRTGLAVKVGALRLGPRLAEAWPA